MKATIKTVLAATATLLESPSNRFGKLEFYSPEAMAAREQIRLWAVEYGVAPSQSVLEQASKVARAVLHANRSQSDAGTGETCSPPSDDVKHCTV